MKFDFSGYATKNNLRCTDGVTIRRGAFADCDGNIVPLMWQHLHDDPSNILGKAFLEHREDGVYAYGVLNDSPKAQNVRELLRHGDINAMSIYATKVERHGDSIVHGDIKEVSLVLAGANPGAVIEPLSIAHSDGTMTDIDDEYVIRHSGMVDEYAAFDMDIDFYDQYGNVISHAADDEEDDVDDEDDEDSDDGETVQDVFNTLTAKQKRAVYAIVGAVAQGKSGSGGGKVTEEEKVTIKQSEGGSGMHYSAFERGANQGGEVLSQSEIKKVAEATFAECRDHKTNFKEALKHAAQDYGIENIELLFPDAKNVTDRPEWVKRRSEWVNVILNGTKHTPFSRIKTMFADITADEARARGYLKGNKKYEEVFPVMSRMTTPQTIYKKQRLDRDDIIDITDFDVVAWLRAEMRVMLDEELARAILLGDGREITSPDKIKPEHIRPIWTDDDFYSYKLQLPSTAGNTELADAFVRARNYYEGSGRPQTFMSPEVATELMLEKDKDGYRMYKTETELADALRVTKINEVPLMYGQKRTDTNGKTWELLAISLNLADYSVGTDRGGAVTNFDDFDIDYNQYKYLIETRCSGALTVYRSAIIIEREVVGGGARTVQSRSNS